MKEGRGGREGVDLPIAKPRDAELSRARYSLPSSSTQPPRVHLAHVAHPDHADALAVLHGDCVARCSAWMSCNSSAHGAAVDKGWLWLGEGGAEKLSNARAR
jgi:hypothetical protein